MPRSVLLAALVLLAAAKSVPADPVVLSIDPLAPARDIPEGFAGISTEITILQPRGDTYYFSPDNKPLIALFKTLGLKSLRVGGNSVDRPQSPLASEADIDSLFAFCKLTGAKVIYSIRLRDGDPAAAATIARYIQSHHGEALDCFAIGNEPQYFKTWSDYHGHWKTILDAVQAAAPGAKICAPDTNPNADWCRNLVTEFGHAPFFAMITQHDYPGGCAYQNPFQPGSSDSNVVATPRDQLIPQDTALARDRLLSADLHKRYAEVRATMVDAVVGTTIPFRMSETNSFWFGGLPDASDTYAAALWSLDYLHWWAAHDARGINFHTGDTVGGGNANIPARYSAFTSSDHGFLIHPLSYGIAAFNLGGHGKSIAVKTSGDAPNLDAYATLSDSTLTITLINTSHDSATLGGAKGAAQDIAIHLPAPLAAADTQFLQLTAPSADVAAKTGLTLGGSSIQADGSFTPTWSPLPALTPSTPDTPPIKFPSTPNANFGAAAVNPRPRKPESPPTFFVRVPPATATLIRTQLKPK